MKKLLLLGLYLCLSLAMQAQITLGAGHIPEVGDKLYLGIDSTEFWYDNPDYDLSTGENKAWSFDLIQIESMQVRDYKEVSEGVVADSFPDADMIGPFFGGEGYYKHDTDGLTLLGYYGSPVSGVELDLSVAFDPYYTVLPAGMTYGDTYTDDYAFYEELINANLEVTVNGFTTVINSATLEVASTIKYEADGWGTFTTPYGTWDVLRIVQTEYRHTQGMAELPFVGWQDLEALAIEGFGYDTIRTIMFINDMEKEPIIEFEIDNDGPNAANSPAQAIRFKIPSSIVDVETPEVPQIDVLAYPNPAINDVSITMTGFDAGNYHINLYNMLGRIVKQQAVELTGDSSTRLDVSDLSRGIYLYNISDSTGKILITKRLVVIKP